MPLREEILRDRPQLYVPMDYKVVGDVGTDFSGYGRHGLTVDLSAVRVPGGLAGPSAAARFAAAPADHRIEWADASWFEVTALTVEIMVKPTGLGTLRAIWSRDNGGGGTNQVWQLRHSATNKAELYVNNGTSYFGAVSTSSLVSDKWHHIVGTFAPSPANRVRVYINGKLEAETATTGNIPTTGTLAMRIGSQMDGSAHFVGDLHAAAFYNYEFSKAQILRHYMAVIGQGRRRRR